MSVKSGPGSAARIEYGEIDMKTGRAILIGAIAFVAGTNLYADNLGEAAAKASAWAKRPIAASPHALEESPWILRGYSPPTNDPSDQNKIEKRRRTKESSAAQETTTARKVKGIVK